jgi:leader peptidase (prepilin peptidase)/N-methyltransferase
MLQAMSEILFPFEHNTAVFIIFLFLIGACIGSFLNVVIIRLPDILFWQWRAQCNEILESSQHTDQTATGNPDSVNSDPMNSDPLNSSLESPPPGLIHPRSRCPKCHTGLTLFQNIPILGYLLLGGKCGFCKQTISPRYPVVELCTALLWVQLGLHFGPTPGLLLGLILISSLIALTVIDLDHHILPDVIVIPLLWIGLISNSFGMFTSLESAVFGAVSGYMALWIIYQIHHRLTGKEGMGYGDFKLLACIGAWLGWEVLPAVILLASVSGTVLAIVLMVIRKRGKDIPVAFGPYLAIAGWATLIWGDSIISNYLQVFQL